MRHPYSISALVVCTLLGVAASSDAKDWFVAPGGSGAGTSAAPFGKIQQGIAAAQAGDTVIVRPGTYAERINSVRAGTSTKPITVRAEKGRGSVIVTVSGETLQVDHAFFVVDGLVFDGKYGGADTLDINSGALGFTLRDSEVRRSSKDCIDMGAPQGVLITGSLIHHCLNASGGRTDAHGIAAGAVRDLTIRDTEIHTFSGDAFQVDAARSAPGWDRVIVENSKFWLAPLPKAENGFAAGTVPGENGVDTKTLPSAPRAKLTVRNTRAWGFRRGLIANMAAFNLKENIDAVLDGVIVRDSEIAFRLRGPGSRPGAHVLIKNSLVYDVGTAFRYEDNLRNFRLWNSTVGLGVNRPFQAASSDMAGLDVRNLLVVGTLPKEAPAATNRAVSASAFVNASAGDYRLAAGSAPVDAGVTLSGVTTDLAGTPRPQGPKYDVGAYEYRSGGTPAPSPSPAPAPSPGPGAATEIVIHAAKSATLTGNWAKVADSSAAGGARVHNKDRNLPKLTTALANPQDYFEVTFYAEAGVPYRVWMRGKAERNAYKNDSAFVQFSNSLNQSGQPAWRIGTTSAWTYVVEDCSGCGLNYWGWQDNGYGVNVLGPTVTFATSGIQRMRVQRREDGVSIDQIVISPQNWLMTRPGAAKGDKTILPATQ